MRPAVRAGHLCCQLCVCEHKYDFFKFNFAYFLVLLDIFVWKVFVNYHPDEPWINVSEYFIYAMKFFFTKKNSFHYSYIIFLMQMFL